MANAGLLNQNSLVYNENWTFLRPVQVHYGATGARAEHTIFLIGNPSSFVAFCWLVAEQYSPIAPGVQLSRYYENNEQ